MGTSISDLTKATGLTKGAIYGNFKNKEDLAVRAFKYNIRSELSELRNAIKNAERSLDKLYAITSFYRGYYDSTKKLGGCPILNIGTDANHTNPILHNMVKVTTNKLEGSIEQIILTGIENHEIKKDIDTKKMARNFYSMIEGCMFMATIHNDRSYLINMMDHIDEIIKTKLAL